MMCRAVDEVEPGADATVRVVAYGQSDVGLVREKNEDRAFVGRQLFVVADGMGGHRAGEVASAMLVDRLDELDASSFETMEAAQDALLESIRDANRRIFEHAQADPEREGMGTTVTAALLFGDTLLWGQVGDTCAYLLRDGALTRVTPDHSFVGALIEAGYISVEEARTHPQRSVILKAVGHKPELDVDAGTPLPLQVGDQVL